MRNLFYILFLLILNINLSGQTIYDTIPENREESVIGWSHPEKFMIFKDFNTQQKAFFEKIDFNNIDCYGKRVFITTTFGKNGKIKNTKIIRPASKYCDSLAYNFVNGLDDWLPGMTRGRFVDVEFLFPITFDSIILLKKNDETFQSFYTTEEEYRKRKEYFDFVFSNDSLQKIIDDYDFFKKYMAEELRENQYVHILTNYRIKRNETIKLNLNSGKNKDIFVLIKNMEKNWILYDYNFKRGRIRVPKSKELLLIFYKEGEKPLLQVEHSSFKNDTTISLNLKDLSKEAFKEEIKKYSP